jgi:hypothetical protein
VCLLAPHEKTSDAPDIPQLVLIPSSFSGITFAMGSQKLLLNVRSEMADTSTSFKSVVWALSAYSSLYVLVVLLAPPTPPPLLMDAVTSPAGKVVAGIALVVHIAVSFTINSQALTSLVRDISGYAGRWGYLSLCMCAVVFCVTLAIPFFADLTSLIGSLTSGLGERASEASMGAKRAWQRSEHKRRRSVVRTQAKRAQEEEVVWALVRYSLQLRSLATKAEDRWCAARKQASARGRGCFGACPLPPPAPLAQRKEIVVRR